MNSSKTKFFLVFILTCGILGIIPNPNIQTATAYTVTEDIFDLTGWGNDELCNASYLTTGYYQDLCLNDEDWYQINITKKDMIRISTHFNHSHNDLDLELYRNKTTFIDGSYGFENNETIEYITGENCTVYFRVYSHNFYNSDAYNLTIDIISSETYDDAFEDNDYIEQSHLLPSLGIYNNLYQYDQDWFSYYLDDVDWFLNIQIYYDNSHQNLTLQLFEDDDFYYTPSLVKEGYNEISYGIMGGGGWIHIGIKGNNIGMKYSLVLSYSNGSEHENYDLESALNLNDCNHHRNITNEHQWFKIWVNSGMKLTTRITYDSTLSKISAYLYNENGDLIQETDYFRDILLNRWINVKNSRWIYMKINGSSVPTEYKITQHRLLNASLQDDYAEENDVIEECVSLDFGIHDNLILWDDDWFRLPSVLAYEFIELRITPKLSYYPITFDIYYQTDDGTLKHEGYSSFNEDGVHYVYWTPQRSSDSFYIKFSEEVMGVEYQIEIISHGVDDTSSYDSNSNSNTDFEKPITNIPGYLPFELFLGIGFLTISIVVFNFHRKSDQ